MRSLLPTLSLAFVGLAACGGGIGAGGTQVVDPDDRDGDGYQTEEDCNDEDAAINPGADEVCNGLDDDCDGLVDLFDDSIVGAVTGFVDADGDGFGNPDQETVACELTAGLVEDNTDCDDSIATVNPEGTEDCNTGADDDCDGETNDQDADNCIAFFADGDGDGFGGPESACFCQATEDFSEFFEEDCDDGDAEIHPDQPEICGDGIDNNCADDADACELRGNLPLEDNATASIFGLAADDLLGSAAAGVGDLTGDGLADLALTVPGYGSTGGAVGVFEGTFLGDAGLDDADALLFGTGGGALSAVAGGQDLSGDGLSDLAVASADANGGNGAVWVWPGPVVGVTNTSDLVEITGRSGDALGLVAALGDLTGDGDAELIVGSLDSGDVFVHTGPHTASTVASDGAPMSGAGLSLSTLSPLGDLDGDGVADFGVGAEERSSTGRFWVFTGWSASVSSVSDADAILEGDASLDRFGHAATHAGDTNGDGYGDFVVGAPGTDQDSRDEGTAYLFFGTVSSGDATGRAQSIFKGELSSDAAAASLSGGSDLNGDGSPDLVIGSAGHDENGTNSGMAYVLYGPWSATQELRRADAFLVGRARRDEAGTAVSLAGDLDGDGFSDILVGSPENDDAASNAGVVDLIRGGGF